MSTFIVFQNLTMAELTPDEKAQLKSKVKLLEPMNMDLLNQKLQLINEDYPLSLPPWAILGFQLVSGGFILTEISMMTWLCIKHRKSIPGATEIWFFFSTQNSSKSFHYRTSHSTSRSLSSEDSTTESTTLSKTETSS